MRFIIFLICFLSLIISCSNDIPELSEQKDIKQINQTKEQGDIDMSKNLANIFGVSSYIINPATTHTPRMNYPISYINDGNQNTYFECYKDFTGIGYGVGSKIQLDITAEISLLSSMPIEQIIIIYSYIASNDGITSAGGQCFSDVQFTRDNYNWIDMGNIIPPWPYSEPNTAYIYPTGYISKFRLRLSGYGICAQQGYPPNVNIRIYEIIINGEDYQNSDIKIKTNSGTIKLARDFNVSGGLRYKDQYGWTRSLSLVSPSSQYASSLRIQTLSGIKAIAKYEGAF